MKKIQINNALKGIYRLIEKNKEQQKSKAKHWANPDKYKIQFEEAILVATELNF